MHQESDSGQVNEQLLSPRPKDLREFSVRAVVCGLVIAAVMGAAYPYVVLKIGFGPSMSMVAAILGYVVLGLIVGNIIRLFGIKAQPYNRWENNIVQTAGSAAASTAFMCVLLAAFDMLTMSTKVDFRMAITPWQSFAWLTSAGILGVFLAVPLRRHYVVDEKLAFPDGVATAETLIVCDSKGPAAVQAAVALVIGLLASAGLMVLREEGKIFKLLPDEWILPDSRIVPAAWRIPTADPAMLMPVFAATGVGLSFSLLAVGSGMIISMRINTSMLIGTIFSWAIMPYVLFHSHVLSEGFRKIDVLYWVMWPATGMMIAGGLAGLFLRWRVLVRTFTQLTKANISSDEFPMRWVALGSFLSAIALIAVQAFFMDQPVWVTIVAIAFSVPLAFVGLRVLGETNWGPISALSNMMQGVFALVARGNVPANMVASGTTGTIATESEGIMQSYKTGEIIGSSPRYLTYMQLLATPIGAAAVAWMYPLLRDTYGLEPKGSLASPISRKWQGFAEVLSTGFDQLPRGALAALIVGSVIGIILAVLESKLKNKTWVPSPTGLGIGMLVPALVVIVMFIGGLIAKFWTKASPRTSTAYMIPLASGFIAGEALIAVIVPVLAILKIIKV